MADSIAAGESEDLELEGRLERVRKILNSPPQIHMGGTGVWSTEPTCYEFLAHHVRKESRTLETGCGVSTLLFTAWGCTHLCVVPSEDQRSGILGYCQDAGIDVNALSFDLRGSEYALPELAADLEYDLVFIDGSHGFPMPIIDWFYGANHLQPGGIVVFDDVQLPQVSLLLEWFLDKDPRWTHLHSTEKWAAYRRLSSGTLSELQTAQSFLRTNPPAQQRSVPQLAKQGISKLMTLTGSRRTRS